MPYSTFTLTSTSTSEARTVTLTGHRSVTVLTSGDDLRMALGTETDVSITGRFVTLSDGGGYTFENLDGSPLAPGVVRLRADDGTTTIQVVTT